MLKIRILVVDDVAFWREFVCSELAGEPSFEVICEAMDGRQAVVMAERLQPTIALMDVGLPELCGIDAAIEIRKLAPNCKILFLSEQRDSDVIQAALDAGCGYVLKSDAGADLIAAIHSVSSGRRFISRELAGLGL
jgi:DNA-binding NarL/FixJ family response regulator